MYGSAMFESTQILVHVLYGIVLVSLQGKLHAYYLVKKVYLNDDEIDYSLLYDASV